MLGRGFIPQIKEIFAYVPADVQVCLFSATIPTEVLEITDKFMHECVKILIEPKDVILEGVAQYHVPLQDYSQKLPTMMQIYKNLSIQQSIVFTNTKEKAE